MIQKWYQLKEAVDGFVRDMNVDMGMEGTGAIGFIQKIYSSTRYVCMTVRGNRKTAYLYLGRGKGYEGVWLGDNLPPIELRIRDTFLEYLRKYLVSAKLMDLIVDKTDRILVFKYRRMQGLPCSYLLLHWYRRNLYFMNYCYEGEENASVSANLNTPKLFLSWRKDREGEKESVAIQAQEDREMDQLLDLIKSVKQNQSTHHPPPQLPLQSSPQSPTSVSSSSYKVQGLLSEELSQIVIKQNNKKIKHLQKKKDNIEADLKICQSWSKIQEKIDSVMNDVEAEFKDKNKFEFLGVKVKFLKEWGAYKKIDHIYRKIKKLKKGEAILQKRYEEICKEVKKANDSNNSKSTEFEVDRKSIIMPVWENEIEGVDDVKEMPSINKNVEENDKNIVEMFIDGKLRVGVGKNAQGNDFLRNSWGKKENWWFHIDGYRGAHAIVRVTSFEEISIQQLRIIASVLADVSKHQIQKIPLVFTQVKNVKGVKGEAGKVTLKKQKYLQVDYFEDWASVVRYSNR